MRYLLLLAITILTLAPAASARDRWRDNRRHDGYYGGNNGYYGGNNGYYRGNYGFYGNRNLPPGIAKKGGWLPPGQAKRYGYGNGYYRNQRRWERQQQRGWDRYNGYRYSDPYRDRYFDWRRLF